MQSDDKRYLGQMLATLDTYRTTSTFCQRKLFISLQKKSPIYLQQKTLTQSIDK